MAAIEVSELRMRYGSRDVLDGIGFVAYRGEVLALLGPNGAGKTTTIEILEGFRTRSGGDVRVLDVDPARAGEDWRARVGIVLQSWRDHGKWRVRELLQHLGRFYVPYARPFSADELIATVGLEQQAGQRIASLSGGERRRLDVAIGIVGRPELLFLDEPTAGFDPEDTTILLTTHDLAEAEKLADRILILSDGKIVADGSADQLAREVAGRAEVRWSCNGDRYVHATEDATTFVRELFAQHGETVQDLEVKRASLEDTYMAMVHREET
jgi:ABC-2 type transport system ATP-binding protein